MIIFYYVSFRFLFKRIGISKSMVDKIKIMVNHLDLPQDVIDIIHFHLEGYYQGRKCASELLMPHFQRTLTSIGKKRWGVRRREEVHPGRDLVRIIRPHFSGFVPCGIKPFEGERVNIHGLSPKPWRYFHNTTNELDCTHDDLNRVLTMLDVKKFRSKKKSDKIQLLIKQ